MNKRTHSRRILRSLAVLVAVAGLLTLALGSALAKSSNAAAHRVVLHGGLALVSDFPSKAAPEVDSVDTSVDETDPADTVDETDPADTVDENDQGDQVDEGDQGENEDAQGNDHQGEATEAPHDQNNGDSQGDDGESGGGD